MYNPGVAMTEIIYRSQYQATDYSIEAVDLTFDLQDDSTVVQSVLQIKRRSQAKDDAPLVLDGDQLELLELRINEQLADKANFSASADQLVIKQLPSECQLSITTRIYPDKNTALSGLYRSNAMYCTQCEAHGFRRITYFLDRPDIMARYTTTIKANKTHYPVLLSNGNLVASGDSADGRHWCRYEDPFKKPSYLFALVAGKLGCVSDHFTTQSGRKVALEIYVEPGNESKCHHAMQSLKQAMAWDEQVYGREYDLDVFMIVAVDHFNMGAMENKGLNIFNAQYILADAETATDTDYQNIESVVAHEYFHNWTGNRITCRDWFQLSLKEGLTVFRDQEFSRDMNSRAVNRIDDVTILRNHQFAEDSGPMAHPVRPDSYIEVNNFYTATVYNKGAELIRMLHTLLGKEGFRAGMDCYFQRHDGQAVTTDDFVQAHADANQYDAEQFKLWYSQSGTPRIVANSQFNGEQFELSIEQFLPETPQQSNKKPQLIPIRIKLFNKKGEAIAASCQSKQCQALANNEFLLLVNAPQQQFVFTEVKEQPVVSFLRDFSAPVNYQFDQSLADLQLLLCFDDDGFARFEAAQRIWQQVIQAALQQGEHYQLPPEICDTFAQLINDTVTDPALLAKLISLPSEHYMFEQNPNTDILAIIDARSMVKQQLAKSAIAPLQARIKALAEPYQYQQQAIAKRSLKNVCLSYLAALENKTAFEHVVEQLNHADNMTDTMAALNCLIAHFANDAGSFLDQFHQKWQAQSLVINKWLALNAALNTPDIIDHLQQLLNHPSFEYENPNRVRAVFAVFAQRNLRYFHAEDASGYRFLSDAILKLNQANPQIAARLVTPLTKWRQHNTERQALMKAELNRILATDGLSKDVYEMVSKSL